MEIPGHANLASLAGTARAQARGGSGSESDQQSVSSTRPSQDQGTDELSIQSSEGTSDRDGDGRQVLVQRPNDDREEPQEEPTPIRRPQSTDGSGESLDLDA